jgi:GTP-binding protein
MPERNTEKQPRAEFQFSAARYAEIPASDKREFCVLGRSNVGKSSFINHVFADNGLARVSRTPGKTTLANFFSVSGGSVWVDLPGYGHSERAKTEQVRWSRLVAEYCEERENLRGVIWLCDSRHPGLEIDKEAFAWFQSLDLPVLAVLTKADKLTRQEQSRAMETFAALFPVVGEPVMFSNAGEMPRRAFWGRFRAWTARLGGQQGMV